MALAELCWSCFAGRVQVSRKAPDDYRGFRVSARMLAFVPYPILPFQKRPPAAQLGLK